jgi:hypothetical protein
MEKESLEQRVLKLEARLQELEDERSIRELMSRYGYNADCRRDKEYIDMYTEDGAMDLDASGREGSDHLRWEGTERLWEFISDPNGHHRPEIYGKSMHLQGNNVVVHVRGNDAVVNSYSVVLIGDGSNVQLITAGNNEWTLRKVDGRWLFKERRRRQIGGSEYVGNLDATPR